MKYIKYVFVFTCIAAAQTNAIGIDNTDRKNMVIAAGLATNSFAIFNREHLKACDAQWDFGYQYGKDKKLYSNTVRSSFMKCEMDTSNVLPWGIEFSVLPTGFVSYWNTNSGSYGTSLYEIGFMPIGQFSKPVGSVYLDASFGLGPDLLSRSKIGNQKKSTLFQFSDEMGVGVSDSKRRLRLSYSYRHISNIDIKLPNNGTNFVGVVGLSYKFD
jgi:hypothetical protein